MSQSVERHPPYSCVYLLGSQTRPCRDSCICHNQQVERSSRCRASVGEGIHRLTQKAQLARTKLITKKAGSSAGMPVAHFVIKRYDREVDRKQVAIFPSTTFKGLGVQWARQAPVKYSAGFTFFSEHGEELPEEGAPEAGQTYIVLAADRDEVQRKVCEDASQVFHKIVRAGRKEEKSGVHGWQLLYAPEEFGEDGRFQKAKEANAYWVLNRTSFGDLERKVQSLLFDGAPPKKNVLLCGPAGTGKSHAVLAVVNSLIRRAQNRAEETRQQAGESSTFVHREGDIAFRVVPILDCGELLRNFTLTVAKGLATGFGDDLLALDEICQLKTADDVFTFIHRQSLRVLFVLDQYQYVVENGNPELRNSMDKLLYNKRSLRVTSAGSDEVKALMKTSHRYIDWFQLSSRLTEVGSVTFGPPTRSIGLYRFCFASLGLVESPHQKTLLSYFMPALLCLIAHTCCHRLGTLSEYAFACTFCL